MEEILDRIAKKIMLRWDMATFKRTHPRLFRVIMGAMIEAAKETKIK